MAALPNKDKLLHNFSRYANWGEEYPYTIELGQQLAPLSPEEHSVQNIIQGYQSQVWIVMTQDPPGVITLRGDSDAAVVKGLIVAVFIPYDWMAVRNIIEFDVRPWFERMALAQHPVPSRSRGLGAMIRATRAKATNISQNKQVDFTLLHPVGALLLPPFSLLVFCQREKGSQYEAQSDDHLSPS